MCALQNFKNTDEISLRYSTDVSNYKGSELVYLYITGDHHPFSEGTKDS